MQLIGSDEGPGLSFRVPSLLDSSRVKVLFTTCCLATTPLLFAISLHLHRANEPMTAKPISIEVAGCRSGVCALKAVELTSGDLPFVLDSGQSVE